MFSYQGHPIRNIVFDLGKVLLQYDWESYLRSFSFDEKTYEIIADAIFRNPDWETGDAGTVTPEEWEELFVENAPDYESDIRRVFSGIRKTISPMPYTEEWIHYFRQRGLSLYFLSNYSEKLHQDTLEHMSFLNDFDGGVFSYEVKCIKPDLRIYQILLERFRLEPSETLFFDDRPENIEAAKKLGIHGVVFTPKIVYDMLQGN